jgi:hypothetical protein
MAEGGAITDQPFQVRTVEGNVIADGKPTESEADFSVTWRNTRAEELGITTRYRVVPKA